MVMTVFLLWFGVPLSLLDLNRTDEQHAIGAPFSHWLPNLLIH